MYTPESHDQMFEIIAALRTFAAENKMPGVAEIMDDALLALTKEGHGEISCPAPFTFRSEG